MQRASGKGAGDRPQTRYCRLAILTVTLLPSLNIESVAMTWVLGAAMPVGGYGALISDARVTWPDGSTRDILQKIYPIGSMMMAGFAGSVELGFAMIADLLDALVLPAGEVWYPQMAVWRWRRRGRWIFAHSRPELQRLGCALIIVGPSPTMNGPWYQARCGVLRSPNFAPTWSKGLQWASIGSGSEHEQAEYFANRYQNDYFTVYGQGEVGATQFGGAALMTASIVSLELRRRPMKSVSEVIQCGIAEMRELRVHDLSSRYPSAEGKPEIVEPGKLAKSWPEFQQMSKELGLSAAEASI